MDSEVNYHHKDRLFRFIFGESKENALDLYNALNNSSYTNANDLEFNTIENVIFLGMKNDFSFIFMLEMDLIEHQSTYNPNMPVRGFIYFGKLIEAYIKRQHLNIYGSKLVKIPTPHYIIFYNGTGVVEDITELHLSTAFEKPGGCLEMTAKMYNINMGRNRDLMEKCKPLYEYAQLIGEIRENQAAGMDISDAVDAAVTDCIKNGIMADLLTKHKAEVIGMLLTEYDEAEHLRMTREEGREEGRQEGRKEGLMEQAKRTAAKLRAKGFSTGDIADSICMDVNLVQGWFAEA